ncbi:MAG: hypothetical protein ACRC0G_11100 [Fusobacteriaceae bacterium]
MTKVIWKQEIEGTKFFVEGVEYSYEKAVETAERINFGDYNSEGYSKDYSHLPMTIVRWLGAFGYSSDFEECLKFEFSPTRERAGEIGNVGPYIAGDIDPTSVTYAKVTNCTKSLISLLFNSSDIRLAYGKDVWSEIKEGILVPSRYEDSEIMISDCDDFQDLYYEIIGRNREDGYDGHTECFLKSSSKPRAIYIKREGLGQLSKIKKVMKSMNIDLPIYIERRCDNYISQLKGGKLKVIKFES